MLAEYYRHVAADRLCHLVPRKFAYWIGLRLADVFFRRDRRGKEGVCSNMRRILEHHGTRPSGEKIERMAKATFRQFGKYMVDFFRFSRISRDEVDRFVTIEHAEYIDQALAGGKGALLVSAHYGNWELGGATLVALGHRINAIVQPMRNSRVEALFRDCRAKRGIRVISLGSAARESIAALRRGEIVCLLADRDFTSRFTEQDFFGAPARFPAGPARLSLKTGAPVVIGFASRLQDDTFSTRLCPPLFPSRGMGLGDIQTGICAQLEEGIGSDPCQWFVFEDFWRRVESGNGENQ
ncbi:MAG: lysophospholipid acyltransferase family protein [Lentisphaerae bacterium]|nr:lysophospholipid acyltransferase family protein [Lentisphaerota bacterium]